MNMFPATVSGASSNGINVSLDGGKEELTLSSRGNGIAKGSACTVGGGPSI